MNKGIPNGYHGYVDTSNVAICTVSKTGHLSYDTLVFPTRNECAHRWFHLNHSNDLTVQISKILRQ